MVAPVTDNAANLGSPEGVSGALAAHSKRVTTGFILPLGKEGAPISIFYGLRLAFRITGWPRSCIFMTVLSSCPENLRISFRFKNKNLNFMR